MKANLLAVICVMALALTANAQTTSHTLVLFGDYTVNGTTYTLGCDLPKVRDIMFTNPDGFSTAHAFSEASYGSYLLTGDVYPAHADNQPYHIDVHDLIDPTFGGVRCGTYPVLSARMEAMATAEGVTIANYDRKVYVLPFNAGCDSGISVTGETAISEKKSWIFSCQSEMTYEHEIGHTLIGSAHSIDDADPMNSQNLTFRLFNASATLLLGWMAPAGIVNLTGDGTYPIAPLEFARSTGKASKTKGGLVTDTTLPQIYQLTTSVATYALSYRQLIGVDRRLAPTNLSGLRINKTFVSDQTRSLVHIVTAGSPFTLDGVTITNNSASQSSLTFTISGLGIGPPTATLSSLSFNPTQASVGSPSTGTVMLSAPATTAATVSLSSDNPAAANIPANVTVNAGQTSASFTATPANVAVSTTVHITASYLGVTKTAALTIVPPPPPACVASPTTLCLQNGRFSVTATFQTTGQAQAVPLSNDTGYFWFFNSANMELAVKLIDGTLVNNDFWVFYGGLTNLEYTITVTDLTLNRTKTYHNPDGVVCGGADTAFSSAGTSTHGISPQITSGTDAPTTCTPGATTLCLQPGGDTIKVETSFRNGSILPAQGGLLPNTAQGGYFTFFSSTDVDLLTKVLDGRSINQHYWTFTGALSDVEYWVTFTNVRTGSWVKVYNPPGNYCGSAVTGSLF